MNKTNKELAKDMNCTSRQISKSRKRGYITNNNGERIKYKAPEPVFITLKATPKLSKNDREIREKIREKVNKYINNKIASVDEMLDSDR